MVLFQLPHRNIVISGGFIDLTPPYEIFLYIKLGPEEYFGAAEATGRLRELIDESDREFEYSNFQGMKRPKPVKKSQAKEFSYDGNFSGVPLSIKENIAEMHFSVDELDTLGQFIQKVIEILPAIFAPISLAPITILEMSGKICGRDFLVSTTGRSTVYKFFAAKVHTFLDLAMPHARALPNEIVASMRYLAQNYLLEYSSEFSNQVSGERILNLCKSLESLLIGDAVGNIDSMRTLLRGWGINERYIEVFSSLKYLRNQLDVAHISYSTISAKSHEAIDKFILLAESCMQALIATAISKSLSDSTLYPARARKMDDSSAIRFLSRYEGLEQPKNNDLSIVPPADAK